jgi:hypothetical protein
VKLKSLKNEKDIIKYVDEIIYNENNIRSDIELVDQMVKVGIK